MNIDTTYTGDNVTVLKGFEDACIDLTVTSPPYDDMDFDYNPIPKNGLREYNGYSWNFKELARQLFRVTKLGGIVVWVVNDPTIDGSESLATSLQKIFFRRAGFNIHDTMIYHTDKPPINDNRYQSSLEYMVILSKGKPKTFNPLMVEISQATKARRQFKHNAPFQRNADGSWNIKSRNSETENRTRDNVWHFWAGFSANDKLSAEHPAVFPEALARDHILSWSNPGDIVLDPFAGSGTTLKMAKETGRHFVGIEISPEYVKICNRRVAGANVPLPLMV